MARAHSTFFSFVTPSTSHTRTPPLILASSLASSRPLKITRRKNYLRPKILKTLIPKPPIVPLPPQEPSPPPETATPVPCPESTQENELLSVEVPSEETHGEDDAADATTEEAQDLEDLQVSEATIQPKDFFGKVYASDVFKFCGVCFLGAVVYQTILSFFFVMNYDSRPKARNLEVNGSERRDLSLHGNGVGSNVLHVMGQVVREKKIEEIKSMAKEARRIEKMEKKELEEEEEEEEDDVDYESDDNLSYGSSPKPGIEREIAARLMKLQNKINGDKHTSAGGVARNGNKNANQGNEQLTFKKKLKYKSPSTNGTKAPKGFPGTRDRKAPDAKNRNSEVRRKVINSVSDAIDHAQISHEDKPVTEEDEEIQGSISSIPLKESGESVAQESKAILNNEKDLERNLETAKAGVKTTNTNNGGVQKTSFELSAVELKQSRDPRKQKSQSFVEDEETDPRFEKDVLHNINGSSRNGLARKKTETDTWWLNLRYVLVILMRGGVDGGTKGLYSLKISSKGQDQSEESYIVAFEDHADANNLCFLLESSFKELGDFSADAVPMSIQELEEEILSRAKKVVVVKKRQLQLFAGQPLGDVEKALRSLIEHDQNVIIIETAISGVYTASRKCFLSDLGRRQGSLA